MGMLNGWRIASECDAAWESMKGDDQVRFCGRCHKHVYNLSAMAKRDAEALLQNTEGRVCTHFYRRKDGKILTSDCPVGFRAKITRFRRRANVVLSGWMAIAPAFAQTPQPLTQIEKSVRNSVTGVVKDPAGAQVPAAKIVVADQETGREFAASTDQYGAFRVANLENGSYIVKIEMRGFRSFAQEIKVAGKDVVVHAELFVGSTGGPIAVRPSGSVEPGPSPLPSKLADKLK